MSCARVDSSRDLSSSSPSPSPLPMQQASMDEKWTFLEAECAKDDANDPDIQRSRTFLVACAHNDEVVVKRLISEGCHVDVLNYQDKTGKTGLALACANGFIETVQILSLTNADVNLSDNEGNTPLIFAAQAGHNDIVRTLLNGFNKLNVNQSNKQGFSALMKAAVQGRTTCAKILLLAGAQANLKDSSRHFCAAEWADYCNRKECAQIIRQFTSRASNDNIKHKVWDNSPSPTKNSKHKDKAHSGSCKFNNNRLRNAFPLFSKKMTTCSSSNLMHCRSESATNIHPSLYDSVENIVRCVSTPIIPDLDKNLLNTSEKRRKKEKLQIPKVHVTLTTKDDSYLTLSTSNRKYKQYLIDNLHF